MIIENQVVEIKWNHKHRKRYEELGYKYTKNGEAFEVTLEHLAKNSNVKIDVECDHCKEIYKLSNYQARRANKHLCSKECRFYFGKTKVRCSICSKELYKNDTQLKNSVTGNYFCSNSCVGLFNKEHRKTRFKRNCVICDKEFEVIPSRKDIHVTCSRRCQGKWQSKYLVRENANNFRGGDIEKSCTYCGQKYMARRHTVNTSRFCSLECKQKHWVENIPHKTEKFRQAHYEGNLRVRQKMSLDRETLPERMVREWLDRNNIEYVQEQGFFRKYYADFWIKNTKIIIEVFGDYWHANPDVYGEGKISLSESQLEQINKDKKRLRDFNKHGFQVVILWERDIYDNLEKLMKEKMLTIYPRNDYTQNA